MEKYLIIFILGITVGALSYANKDYVLDITKIILLYLGKNWIGLLGLIIMLLTYLNSLK